MAGPAVDLTSKCLWDSGPSLLRHRYYETNMGLDKVTKKPNKPAWLWRLQAVAGPQKSGDDPHIAGRALDVVLFATIAEQRALGDTLCGLFADLRADLKLITIIYNHWEWGARGPRFPRGGQADDAIRQHETHIHLEWSATGVVSEDFGDTLRAQLNKSFWDANQEIQIPYGPPDP